MSDVEEAPIEETAVDGLSEESIDAAAESVAIKVSELSELTGEAAGEAVMDLETLLDVPVLVTVEVGRTRISLGKVCKLTPGALLSLEREAHEPADVLVNGKIVARGEVVTIEDQYGVRITSVIS